MCMRHKGEIQPSSQIVELIFRVESQRLCLQYLKTVKSYALVRQGIPLKVAWDVT